MIVKLNFTGVLQSRYAKKGLEPVQAWAQGAWVQVGERALGPGPELGPAVELPVPEPVVFDLKGEDSAACWEPVRCCSHCLAEGLQLLPPRSLVEAA